MEAQVAQILQQNQELLNTLANRLGSNQKVAVQFEKFNEETELFDSFVERLENYMDIQKVSAEQRAKVLISSLSPKLYQLLKNLLAPNLPSDQSLEDLKAVLRKHLTPKPLIIPSRHRFLNRKQHEGEAINTYLVELRALAVNCEYDSKMLNIMLRDVFVSGLRNKMILDRLFEEDNIDLDKTVQIALAMERAYKGASDVLGSSANINAVSEKPKKRGYKSDKKRNLPQGKNESCTRCTGIDHASRNCKFKNSECYFCHKTGHISKACFAAKRKAAKQSRVDLKVSSTESQDQIPMFGLNALNDTLSEEEPKRPPIMINLKIEDQTCSMEVDTGGTVSVMSLKKFRKISEKKIQPTKLVFKTYSGDTVVPLGYVTVKVQYDEQVQKLNLYIVKQDLETILGREWLYKLKLNWQNLNAIRSVKTLELNELLEKYKVLFDEKLGEINNHEVNLELKPGVKPIFCRYRNVPFALKTRVEEEIARLEKEGIIEKAESSEWATPVVPIVKPDGNIRLCADYSVTLNPNLVVPQHPLPKLEEIFSSLNGGNQFSKLDFSHAYLQMKVNPESQKLLTINTHKGLYVCKRLMFGLNGAPAIWQRYVDGLFQGMEGVKVFMDDARMTGKDKQSHLKVLENFFEKCKQHGLKLNLKKSKFFQDEINFLGHKINSEGLHKTNEKISSVVNAHVPKDVYEVKSFLGLVNFYGKFFPNLSTIANPLNELTKKDVKFFWSDKCQKAFQRIKREICSERVLAHYDPNLPISLATDASPVGVGGVLSHVFPGGRERPIAFASKTLTTTERKYSQLDKEALAIVWAVKKFYLYLKGSRFTLITDHRPLVHIFGSKKGLPVLTATRLLHYALTLQSFQFDIVYRNTKDHGNADFLSRFPKASEDFEVMDDVKIFQLSQIETLPVTAREIREATKKDSELGPLLQDLLKGKDLKGKEARYSIEDGCIMYGQRVWVPRVLQKKVLDELHEGHLGTVKMKAIARSFVYWFNIDKDIEETVRNCKDCFKHKADPSKVRVHHWEYPSFPWERIHVDFAGPIFEHMFLVIVDAYSKWLEVYTMKVTTASKTIECLRDCFSRFGLPVVLVSDNGPQFTSLEFRKFLNKNGIKHKTCAPFKPSTNGQAERYVYTLKQSLRAMQRYPGTIQQKVLTFLMNYRKAPNMTTSLSPAMLFLKREIRTRLDLLLPDQKERIHHKIRKDVYFQDRKFEVGDKVAIRDYRSANSRWKIGTILNQDGELHYTVNVNGNLDRRHVDQIRPAGDHLQRDVDDVPAWKSWRPAEAEVRPETTIPVPTAEPTSPLSQPIQTAPPQDQSSPPGPNPRVESDSTVISSPPGTRPDPDPRVEPERVLRRSTRVRKPPDRLGYPN